MSECEERDPRERGDPEKREIALRFEERLERVRGNEAYRWAKEDRRDHRKSR